MTAEQKPQYPVETFDTIQQRLIVLHTIKHMPWRTIALLTEYKGVPAGTLCDISKGHEPKSARIRLLLHLPALAPAPVCSTCGEVHLRKSATCPKDRQPRPPRAKISDLETSFLFYLKVWGLPEPIIHHRFHPTRRWEFDFAWLDRMIAVEMEGGVYTNGAHVRGKHYESDCEKYNEAQILGWRVYRFTVDMLSDSRAEKVIFAALGIPNDHGVFKSMGLVEVNR